MSIPKPGFFHGWYVVACGFLSQEMRVGLGPPFGFAVDRNGPRFLMAGRVIVLSISLMLLSQTHEIWQFALFYGVLGAFGVSGMG